MRRMSATCALTPGVGALGQPRIADEVAVGVEL
jgi:hypothetical protein